MARDGDEIWTRAGRNPNWTARPSREWWGGGGEGGRVAREWRNLKFCGIKNRSKKKNISRLRWSPEHGEFIYSQIVEISFGRTFVCFDQRTVLNFIRAFGRVVWRETLEWEGRREREIDREKGEGEKIDRVRPGTAWKYLRNLGPFGDSTSTIKRWNGS